MSVKKMKLGITRSIAMAGMTVGLGLTALPALADSNLSLDVAAEVEPRCELSNISDSALDFSDVNAMSITFSVYCNTEMTIQVSSSYGGILNEDRADRSGDTSEFLRDYVATVSLSNHGFNQSASSAELAESVVFNIDGVVFDDTGKLEIELDRSIQDGYAGEYRDSIRLSVYPSLATLN